MKCRATWVGVPLTMGTPLAGPMSGTSETVKFSRALMALMRESTDTKGKPARTNLIEVVDRGQNITS